MRALVPIVVLMACGGSPAPAPSSPPARPAPQVVVEAPCEAPGGEQPEERAHLVGEPFCRQSTPTSRACITFDDDGSVTRTFEEPELDLRPRVFPSPPMELRLVGLQLGCWRLDDDTVVIRFGDEAPVAMRLEPAMQRPDAPPFLMLVEGEKDSYVRGRRWLDVDRGIFARQ